MPKKNKKNNANMQNSARKDGVPTEDYYPASQVHAFIQNLENAFLIEQKRNLELEKRLLILEKQGNNNIDEVGEDIAYVSFSTPEETKADFERLESQGFNLTTIKRECDGFFEHTYAVFKKLREV